jgi:hypothetical protein
LLKWGRADVPPLNIKGLVKPPLKGSAKMAETLQRLLACDTCGSSELQVMIGHCETEGWVRLVFICRFMHRTEVKVERAL